MKKVKKTNLVGVGFKPTTHSLKVSSHYKLMENKYSLGHYCNDNLYKYLDIVVFVICYVLVLDQRGCELFMTRHYKSFCGELTACY